MEVHMATTTMSIAMPEEMRAYVEERIRTGQFGNASEYFRHLVREDAKRAAEERLVALLLEGEKSGDVIPMDDAWRARHREELMKRVGEIKRKKRA
jgi:antitoxin ParD1/3/4